LLVEGGSTARCPRDGQFQFGHPISELRSREYLTPAEVERLAKAARNGRYGHRDAPTSVA
jgi:hypothetical protein